MSWKSCGNCSNHYCGWNCNGEDWRPIPCPLCGGALSEIREQGGKKYRHCYSCHAEVGENGKRWEEVTE